jgi:hypothetical protein
MAESAACLPNERGASRAGVYCRTIRNTKALIAHGTFMKTRDIAVSGAARFTERVLVRCPASLPPAIDRAAAQNLMTPSEYVRRCVIDRLRADGVDPAAFAVANRNQ